MSTLLISEDPGEMPNTVALDIYWTNIIWSLKGDCMDHTCQNATIVNSIGM